MKSGVLQIFEEAKVLSVFCLHIGSCMYCMLLCLQVHILLMWFCS